MQKSHGALILSLLFLGGLGWGLFTPSLEPVAGPVSSQDSATTREQIQTELSTFAQLARELKPSVVNISVVKPNSQHALWQSRPNMTPESLGQGSGVVISADGEVLTNNHVVDGATTIRAKLGDGREFQAEVIGADPSTDLALLRLSSLEHSLPVARLGDSDRLEVGDWVMAIGNPFGLEATVTVGVLSGKGRSIGASDYDDFLQTDASINPGNSGGPLFNTQGEVVGINTAIVPGGQGIGFSIPINLAKEVAEQLRTRGKMVRGFVGVGIQPLTPALKSALKLDPELNGALVTGLLPGGPAHQAGLQPGDVICAVAREPILTSRELLNRVARLQVGSTVEFEVLRQGRRLQLSVPIAERPSEQTAPPAPKETPLGQEPSRWGFAVTQHPAGESGVAVVDVVPGSPAARAGLLPGDTVRSVGATPITDVEPFLQLLSQAEDSVALLVDRQGRALFLALES